VTVRIARFLALALFATCAAARADVISVRPDGVAVTFYHEDAIDSSELLHAPENSPLRNTGLAFISETRTVDLPAGPATVKFQGVTSTMVPQTANIQGLPAGVLEQNFDYDLLSPGSLLAKSIGETVQLVRTDTKSGKRVEEAAIIRSGPAGAVFEINGKFEALRCSALPEKLVFEHIPGGLTDTPTLSVRTMAPQPGRYTITLSYIATGLNWSADYVAHIKPGSNTLELRGWLTLANFSDTGFDHVPVNAVAGRLQTTGSDRPIREQPLVLAANCWPTKIDWATYPHPPPPPPPPPGMTVTGRRIPQQGLYAPSPVTAVGQQEIEFQALGDYKLYPLPEPVTVAARQTKQIQFVYRPEVKFERVYRYSVDGSSPDPRQKTEVVLRLRNRTEDGLGKPLPAGGVSIFETTPDGSPIFAGEDSIRDMAENLPIEIKTGRAMDVSVEARVTDDTTAGSGQSRKEQRKVEVAVQNEKAVPIQFELRQFAFTSMHVDTDDPVAAESGFAVWRFKLAPGEHRTLRYTMRWPE
jgi:hypothetical protein